MARPLYPQERDPVLIVQEAGLALRPVWTNSENLASPPGFDFQAIQPVVSRYTDYTPFRPIAQYVVVVTACYFTFPPETSSR